MTPAPAPLQLDDLKPRTLMDDMTQEERRLLTLDYTHWGTPRERAHRGALYLDRVMPDWYERVEVKYLDLADECRCVLGQIFESPSAVAIMHDSGFSLGCEVLLSEDAQGSGDASIMLGFDYGMFDVPSTGTGQLDWRGLTAAWREEVSVRQAAAAAG